MRRRWLCCSLMRLRRHPWQLSRGTLRQPATAANKQELLRCLLAEWAAGEWMCSCACLLLSAQVSVVTASRCLGVADCCGIQIAAVLGGAGLVRAA